MSRKKRWKTDPITGMRYERGSLMDIANKDFDFTYNKPSKRKSRSYREGRYEHEGTDLSELPPWAQILVGILIISVLIYVFLGQAISNWWNQNWLYVVIVIIVIVGVIVYIYFNLREREKIREAERRILEQEQTNKRMIFEQEQTNKGLVKFVDRHGYEKWGKPEEIEQWRREDEEAKVKESLFNRVVKEIEEFRPAREELRNEYAYHLSLFSWLKKTFPETEYEKQKGHSRPDIVVGNIAIEVKGPTDNQALITIADKCMRYSKYFQSLIVVLFEVHVNHERYEEWLSSLKSQFPNVEVIRK